MAPVLTGENDPASFLLQGRPRPLRLPEDRGRAWRGRAWHRLRPPPHPRGRLVPGLRSCACASPGLEAAMMVGVHGGAEPGARGGGGGRGDGAGRALMSLFVSPLSPPLPPVRRDGGLNRKAWMTALTSSRRKTAE